MFKIIKNLFKNKDNFGFVKKIDFNSMLYTMNFKTNKKDLSTIFEYDLDKIIDKILNELEYLSIDQVDLISERGTEIHTYSGTFIGFNHKYGLIITIGKYKVYIGLDSKFYKGDLKDFNERPERISLILGDNIYYMDFFINHIEFNDYCLHIDKSIKIEELLKNKILNYFNTYAEMKYKEFIYKEEYNKYNEKKNFLIKMGFNIDEKIIEEFKPLKKDFIRIENIKEQIDLLNNEINLIRKKYD